MAFQGQSGLDPQLRPQDQPPNPLHQPQIQIGRVLRTNPNNNSVDVALLSGSILREVQVAAPDAGHSFGTANLPIATEGDGTAKHVENGENVYAVVAFVGGKAFQPIVIGYLFPEVSPLLGLPAKYYQRIPGGMHHVVEKDTGNHEWWYGDGSYLRAASGDAFNHYNMGGKDFDGVYGDMTGGAPYGFALQHVSGNMVAIHDDGQVHLKIPAAPKHGGDVLKIDAGGVTITVNAGGTVTISGNLAVNGTVTGDFQI